MNGQRKHVFSRGWERLYYGEWISEAMYFKLKIKGL